MAEILIFRHTPDDGPGYLGRYLEKRGLPHRVVCIDAGESVPAELGNFSGIALMGGPQSANDPLPWIPPLLRLVRDAVERDVPVIGHCLGGQLIARALGGQVTASPSREIGWLPVRQVPGPGARSWLSQLPEQFEVFQWHWESFSLPQGAELVLASDGCPRQAFAIGRTLALQCHIEMLPEMVREWAADPGDALDVLSPTVQSADEMVSHAEQRAQALHGVADRIYGRWVEGLR